MWASRISNLQRPFPSNVSNSNSRSGQCASSTRTRRETCWLLALVARAWARVWRTGIPGVQQSAVLCSEAASSCLLFLYFFLFCWPLQVKGGSRRGYFRKVGRGGSEGWLREGGHDGDEWFIWVRFGSPLSAFWVRLVVIQKPAEMCGSLGNASNLEPWSASL